MNAIQSFKIEITPVHCVPASRFPFNNIHHWDIVCFPRRNKDKVRYLSLQVDNGVHLDGGFCAATMRPRKHRWAKVNRCRVKGVDTGIEIENKRRHLVKCSCFRNENFGKIVKYFPVALMIGVSDIAPNKSLRQTKVI